MRLVVSSLAVLALLGSAHASTVETVKVEITYNKEAVQTPEGAADVLKTIERKARKDCRIGGSIYRIVNGRVDEACFADIVAKAVIKIDAPALTAVYQKEMSQ